MDYDLVKSKTLLFFFEYLMHKGRPQKLRALTYRFNDKNFTKDMRIIVEGNVAGLKKLLSEHPSLFTIDGDMVDLRTYEPTCDYIQETKDYFKQKLLLYGIGNEVPIVSLEGHRSQASFRIRQIAGPIDKLKQFLSQHPDTFQIIGENVLLLAPDDLTNVTIPQRSIERFATQEICDNELERQRMNEQSNNDFVQIHNESVATSTSNETEPVSISMNNRANGCDSTEELENLCEDNCPKLYDASNVTYPGQSVDGVVENLMMPSSLNYFIDDKWQEKVLQNTKVILTVAHSVRVTNEILNSITNTGDQAIISLDCKVASVEPRPQEELTLIQLGTTCGQALLFDVLTCPKMMTEGGLKALLESERVIKVTHGCPYKSLMLHRQFEVILKNVFDTQSANAILQYQNNGTRVSDTKKLSFNVLVQLFYGPLSSMNFVLPNKMWKQRPLTQEIIIGAARNVLLLIDEKLYGSMAISIKPENKSLLSDLCSEQILSLIRPREVHMKRKMRSIGYQIIDSKQKIAQSNKKIVLSNREIRYLKHANLTVDEMEKVHGNQRLLRKLKTADNIRKDNESHDEANVSKMEYTSHACSLSGTFPSTQNEPSSFSESCEFLPKISTDRCTKDKVGNNFQAATIKTSSENVGETFANVAIANTEVKETKNCCKCYVDNGCQTLSTGDIVIKGVYCSNE